MSRLVPRDAPQPKLDWKGNPLSRNQRILLFAAFLLFGSAGSASRLRAQEPSQPSTSSAQPGLTPSQQPADNKPGEKKDPPASEGTAVTGRSKLEKETGTVNDRIFTVMPNYGTVENSSALPPLTTGQKYRLATAGVFDYFAFPFNMALAGIDQANNSPKS